MQYCKVVVLFCKKVYAILQGCGLFGRRSMQYCKVVVCFRRRSMQYCKVVVFLQEGICNIAWLRLCFSRRYTQYCKVVVCLVASLSNIARLWCRKKLYAILQVVLFVKRMSMQYCKVVFVLKKVNAMVQGCGFF